MSENSKTAPLQKHSKVDAKPPRRSQKDRRAETKSRLIEAAIDYLSKFGFKAFAMAEIAEKAGYSRGAIQHYYASREALIVDIVEKIALSLNPDISHLSSEMLDSRARADKVVDAYWRNFNSKEYLAVIEIIVFSRLDKKLHKNVSKSLSKVDQQGDLLWFEIFRDVNPSAEKLRDLRIFMLATMRGWALRSMLETNENDQRKLLSTLKSMIYADLSKPSA